MKRYVFFLIYLLCCLVVTGQDKYFTKNGRVAFSSKATLENIEAVSKTASCVLDTKTGNLQFLVQIKSFEFEKSLMQEHFNENYMESGNFPKAVFKGVVINNAAINYTKEGNYTAKVKGDLTIHGQTNSIETSGAVEVKQGNLYIRAAFSVLLPDYKIKNDKLGSISNNINIQVQCMLEPLKQ